MVNIAASTASYGYTAYGANDQTLDTGLDAGPNPNPSGFIFNSYRFGAGRMDPSTGNLDLGVGTYDPNINGFISRSALAVAPSVQNMPMSLGELLLGLDTIQQGFHTVFQTNASLGDKVWAGGWAALAIASDVGLVASGAGWLVKGAAWAVDAVRVARLAKGADEAITAASDAEKLVTAADEAVTAASNEGRLSRGGSAFPESEQLDYTPAGKIFGQTYEGSCVAGCARMALSDFGQVVPEAYIRNAAGVDTMYGGSIRDLPGAFEKLGGPKATYVEGGTLEDLQRATAGGNPAIASVELPGLRHAVVVDAFRETDIGTTVLIRDPLPVGSGSAYQILSETFQSGWTGNFVHFP